MIQNVKAKVEKQIDTTNKKLLQVKGSQFAFRFDNTQEGKIDAEAGAIIKLPDDLTAIYVTATEDAIAILI